MDSRIIFGTGGVRGIMGDKPGLLNHAVIQKVTHGLAKVILSSGAPKSAGIAYDTRNNSAEFAKTVCEVLSAFGIEAYCFDKTIPTPVLSFAIRHMGLGWGVCITASHNPREYNGYKVYDCHGVQVTDGLAKAIAEVINSLDDSELIPAKRSELIKVFDSDVIEAYFKQVIDFVGVCEKPSDFSFVYSALHGAGANAVPFVLKSLGFSPVLVQQEADGDFGGLKTPNPEEPVVYEKALTEADKAAAKLILATDPDCDRVGVMVRTGNGFELLNGNQIGALLIDYLFKLKNKINNNIVISTIVSGLLGELISKDYGFEFVRLLTGFKYIGEYIVNLPDDNHFFFGYEESYGYLAGDGARDKDAVIASALIVKMAAFYDKMGMTLLDKWHELSEKYGYCLEALHSFEVSQDRQQEIMSALRSGEFNGVTKVEDYKTGLKGLPSADVIKLYFKNNDDTIDSDNWAAIRPSGTEPKLKVYVGVCAKTYKTAKTALKTLTDKILLELGV